MCIFCRSLFVLLYFFFWPLCCLFFFDIWILMTPFASSNSSYHMSVLQRPSHHAHVCADIYYIYKVCQIYSENFSEAVAAVIIWQLDLQLPMQSVLSIPTDVVSLNLNQGEVYNSEHYVLRYVSDLRQVSGFLQVFWFPPPIKLTAMI